MYAHAIIALPGPLQTAEVMQPAEKEQPQGPPGPHPLEAVLEQERLNLADARRTVETVAEAVANLETEVLRGAEAQLVDLALQIAQTILAQEIEGGRHRIEPIVQEALRQAPTRKEVVVHLNPQDLAEWQKSGPLPAGNVRFIADSNTRRAECFVETAEGTVPVTIADRLEQVTDTLKQP